MSTSHFALFLDAKVQVIARQRARAERRLRRAQDSGYSHLLVDWKRPIASTLDDARLPDAAQEALDYTGFALDEWKTRAERDNFVLLMLATHTMGTHGTLRFERMHALASARDIPIVDQRAYIARRNGRIRDATWAHDGHWNAQGHQWAAEALLEWLEQNRDACG